MSETAAPRIRVLVVDDSVAVRRLLTSILSSDPGIQVVGTAADGKAALAALETLQPDVMTLDVEMPVLDGLGTLRELRKRWRALPVIMLSTLTVRGAEATLAVTTDKTIIIPGHGQPVSNRAELQAYRDMLVAIRDNVAALKRQGRSLEEIVAAKPTAAYDAKWGQFVIGPALFTKLVYEGV